MNECPACQKDTDDDLANFCTYCGAKLHAICPSCWKNNNSPYVCGNNNCPDSLVLSVEETLLDQIDKLAQVNRFYTVKQLIQNDYYRDLFITNCSSIVELSNAINLIKETKKL